MSRKDLVTVLEEDKKQWESLANVDGVCGICSESGDVKIRTITREDYVDGTGTRPQREFPLCEICFEDRWRHPKTLLNTQPYFYYNLNTQIYRELK
jgi:hypothetical protein